jgi:hypothetical protein
MRLQQFESRQYGLGDLTKSQTTQAIGVTAINVAPLTGPAAPFVAAAGAIMAFVANFTQGCGNTCIAATRIVNELEPYLKKNVADYLAIPTPRPSSAQQAALAVFDQVWSTVVTQCSNGSLGDAGARCISDRQRGGKWDWFAYYRDPIASDGTVVDDSVGANLYSPSSVLQSVSNVVSGHTVGIGVGLAILGFIIWMKE